MTRRLLLILFGWLVVIHPTELLGQSVTTARPSVDIGPVGGECRVETCVEARAERTGICAVQVLDASGSMDTNGRFAAAQVGISQFVDSLDGERGDRIGLFTFSGPERQFGATPQSNPGPPSVKDESGGLTQSFGTLQNLLPGLSTASVSALTPLAAAISAAAEVLQQCPAGALPVMVISTDGFPNWYDDIQCTITPLDATGCTDAAVAAATGAKQAGVHIVTIGIDLDANDSSDAFGISLLQGVATSPDDANFFNTGAGLGQADIFSHLAQTVASPAEVTFFEPLPDSCWTYVPASTTGSTTDDPVPGLVGSSQTLAWDLGIVSDGQTAGLCYAMAFDPVCGEPPTSVVVQSGAEVLWQLADGSRASQSIETQRLENIKSCQIAIPVELVGFFARSSDNGVTLSWNTASETNNSGFGVERAAKDETFKEIGFVPGYGTSRSRRQYVFSDEALAPGSYRYRLRQVDLDGTFEFSPVLAVTIEVADAYFLGAVYPNPIRDRASIEIAVARTQQVKIELIDTMGRLVMIVADEHMQAGTTRNIIINASQVPSGIYIVRAVAEYFTTSKLASITR